MCGISGFIGYKDQTEVNLPLVLYNALRQDSRGRDNAGIAFRTSDEKGIVTRVLRGGTKHETGKAFDTKTLSQLIFSEKETLEKLVAPFFFLSHSRKKSLGSTDMSNAHPYLLQNDEKTKYILGVHNGTIHNIEAICKELGVETRTHWSDSKKLFKCFVEYPDKIDYVLSSYDGGASLVWCDPADLSKIYVWTGKERTVYNRKGKQERDLHYMRTKEGLHISSEVDPLETVFLIAESGHCEIPEVFLMDTITTIEYGIITETRKIKRTSISSTVGTTSKKVVGGKGVNKTMIQLFPPKNVEETQLSWNLKRIYMHRGNYFLGTRRYTSSRSGQHIFSPEGFKLWTDPDTAKVYFEHDHSSEFHGKIQYGFFYNGIRLNSLEALDIVLERDSEGTVTDPFLKLHAAHPISTSSVGNYFINHTANTSSFSGEIYYKFSNMVLKFQHGEIINKRLASNITYE